MSIQRSLCGVLCGASLLAGGHAFAAGEKPESPVVTLACGGVTSDESERMLSLEKAQALTVIFSTAQGSYLSGVNTRVEDALAGVQAERSCGPIGHVNVSTAGRYRVVADHDGVVREQWVELTPFGGARIVLSWPD